MNKLEMVKRLLEMFKSFYIAYGEIEEGLSFFSSGNMFENDNFFDGLEDIRRWIGELLDVVLWDTAYDLIRECAMGEIEFDDFLKQMEEIRYYQKEEEKSRKGTDSNV